MAKGLKLEELEVYKVAMEIGELVWQIVIKWEYFEKKDSWCSIRKCC